MAVVGECGLGAVQSECGDEAGAGADVAVGVCVVGRGGSGVLRWVFRAGDGVVLDAGLCVAAGVGTDEGDGLHEDGEFDEQCGLGAGVRGGGQHCV